MQIAALIITFNRKEVVKECILSVLNSSLKPDKVLVVDNGSTDGTPQFLKKEFPEVTLLSLDKNYGPAGGAERGQRYLYEEGYDFIWMLDDDAIIEKDALSNLIKMNSKLSKEIGNNFFLLSVIYGDRKLQKPLYNIYLYNQTWGIPVRISDENYKKQYFPFIVGPMLGLFLPKYIFEKVGFFRGDFFGWYDDTEYVLRVHRNGFQGYAVPNSKIYHPTKFRKKVQLLGRKFTFYSGRPKRFYYGTRNNIITQREMLPWFNFYFLFLPLFIFRRFASILIFYEDKDEFLKCFFKGIISSFKLFIGGGDV